MKTLLDVYNVYEILSAVPKAFARRIYTIDRFVKEFSLDWISKFPKIEYYVMLKGGTEQKKDWQDLMYFDLAWLPTAEMIKCKKELARKLEIWVNGVL